MIVRRVPMIFPGQGSQAVGMAKDLSLAGGPAAEFLGGVDRTLGRALTELMFAGPAETLTETRNAQPAILAHSVAVTLALQAKGIVPSLVAGHSLGEFSAAVACGALCPFDALRVVQKRGELMFAAGLEIPGTMAAVLGLSGSRVAAICREGGAGHGVVVLANHNSEGQVAISGEVAAVAEAGRRLAAAGARKVIPLNVSGAFHSPLLREAGAAFREFLKGIAVADPAVPLISNVDARPATSAAALVGGFGAQLTAPVLWHDTMERLTAGPQPPPVVLEVGPGRVLTNLAKRAYPRVRFLPVGTLDEIDQAVAELAGLPAPSASPHQK